MSSIVTFLPPLTFFKKSKAKNESSLDNLRDAAGLKLLPIVLDFGRLLKESTKITKEVLKGTPNVDLLHAVANLYGVCLPEITADIIYPTLCEKWSKTLLMVQDEKQARVKLHKNLMKPLEGASTFNKLLQKPLKEQSTKEEENHLNIFSDDESDNGDDENDDDDFMSGMNEFLQRVDTRKTHQYECVQATQSSSEEWEDNYKLEVGIENRLVGGITFERSYEKPGERILHLTLMAVRKKYRSHRVGSFMMKKLFDPTLTGGSDVILVNADHSAVEFFEKQGFTDDALLNSRYANIGDSWFNSRRMCFLPSYARAMLGHQMAGENLPSFDLREMELEMGLWRERSLQAYQSHASIVQRMRQEILMLHARVSLQNDVIMKLQTELELKKESDLVEEEERLKRQVDDLKEKLSLQVDVTTSATEEGSCVTSSSAHDFASTIASQNTYSIEQNSTSSTGDEETTADASHSDVVKHELTVNSVESSMRIEATASSPAHDDLMDFTLLEIKHCFLASMNSFDNTFSGTSYDVINVINLVPAKLPFRVTKSFNEVVEASHNPDIVANLYYCGSRPIDEGDFPRIMQQGFGESDFVQSNYGKGLHFTRYARCASRFSPPDQILVAKVCLGNTQTITSLHLPKLCPPDGFDSILTQGRLSVVADPSRRWNLGCSEYIVFRPDQAIPVALICYQSTYS